ncbi:MAG: DNA-binding domain-containing protein [Myxococcota bacterium]
MSTSLAELQALFWDAIQHPTGIDDFLAEASPEVRQRFDETFVDTPHFSARQRMTVYAESYFWRLSEVLHQQYRVVAWLCGPARMHNLVTDFIWKNPSRSRDVRRFGRGFAAFVQTHAIAGQIEGIEALAQVERTIVDTLDAPNCAVVGPDALAAQPLPRWPSMRFVVPPYVTMLATTRSYPDLYEARRREEPAPDPVPPPDGRTHHVLVSRQGLEVFHRSVQPAEARALRALLDGEPFERICAAAATSDDGDAAGPEAVVAWLQRWLRGELIAGIA